MAELSMDLPGRLLAYSSAPLLRLCGRARRWIQAALGAFFGFAGLKLLSSRL